MKRSETRILTTHVGSLPRPARMLELASLEKGPPKDPAEYAALLRESVADIVRKQVAVGVDIVNDGEFGKESWANYIIKRVSGFEVRPDQRREAEWLGSDRIRFRDFIAEDMPGIIEGMATEACVGPVSYRGQNEIALAVGALTDALREEYLTIHRAGLLVQVDDAVLANMYDALVSQSPQRYREWAQLRIDALNHALRDIPQDRVRYHLCFGSWHLPHISDAPLEEIVEFILQVKAGAYSIEAANPRHEHEWRVWEQVALPKGKILIPGVITHHIITAEHPRLVADRIIRFANLVGPDNVIAGTDCGFAQLDSIRRVHPEVMWAKFEALVEGAAIASGEIWG